MAENIMQGHRPAEARTDGRLRRIGTRSTAFLVALVVTGRTEPVAAHGGDEPLGATVDTTSSLLGTTVDGATVTSSLTSGGSPLLIPVLSLLAGLVVVALVLFRNRAGRGTAETETD